MRKVQYLIVGQGIAGSLLAWEMEKGNLSFLVLDEETDQTASNRAAGLYNPITGRKMVKTWLADLLFSDLEAYYQSLGEKLKNQLLQPKTIYRPFVSLEEQNDWQGKAENSSYQDYVGQVVNKSIGVEGLKDPFGGLMIKKSGYVDVPLLVRSFRSHLKESGRFASGIFDIRQLQQQERGYQYQDIAAEKVIFTEGAKAISNPFWSQLPFRLVKGELIRIQSDFQNELIVNRNIFIIPKDGSFLVGSTYDHDDLSYEPSAEGIRSIEHRLQKVFTLDYHVLEAIAGIRPATYDRKPFIGLHPENHEIGIFNGFGTKGVSMVPFFARQMVNFLLGKETISEEVNVRRIPESA